VNILCPDVADEFGSKLGSYRAVSNLWDHRESFGEAANSVSRRRVQKWVPSQQLLRDAFEAEMDLFAVAVVGRARTGRGHLQHHRLCLLVLQLGVGRPSGGHHDRKHHHRHHQHSCLLALALHHLGVVVVVIVVVGVVVIVVIVDIVVV